MAYRQYRPVIERFFENVRVEADGKECWVWTGNFFTNGRGKLCVEGKERIAYRIAWELAYGDIPEGLCVCHVCDNPACVKPTHLFVGTTSDNLADMRAKGRDARGFDKPGTRLSEENVKQICLSNTPAKEVAERFGVSANYVYILRSRFRRHNKMRSKVWQPEFEI